MIKKFLWLIFVIAMCFGFTGLARANLIAYYPFDGDLNDDSGNSKNGVFWSNGSSTATPAFGADRQGKANKALSLQAFDSYDTNGVGGTRTWEGVILPDETYFDLTDAITTVAWVKFNSVMGVGTQGRYASIVAKGKAQEWHLQSQWNSATNVSRFGFRIEHSTGNTSTYSVLPGTTNNVDALDYDTWYHVAMTYDSADGWLRSYVNGVANVAMQRTASPKEIYDRSDRAASIGNYANSDYTPDTVTTEAYTTDGLIDEVAIFDTALTDANVQFIYETDISAFIAGALAYINESSGSTDVCEGGLLAPATDSYTIKIYGKESGDPNVTITLGYDSDQITVSPTAASIAAASSWQAEITVTAINDSAVEGPHNSPITHTVTCSDPNGADYNWGYDPDKLRDVIVQIRDDDVKSVIVTESGGTTAVAETFSTTDSYTVSLGGVPSASVVMSLTYESDQITLSPTGLTFTTGNWYQAQTVTVTAVDDEVLESGAGETHTTIIEASCAGGGYDAIEVDDVTVSVTDDEPYCGDPNTTAIRSVADISGPEDTWDCHIDLYDLAKMAEDWLICNDPTDAGCDADAGGSWPGI